MILYFEFCSDTRTMKCKFCSPLTPLHPFWRTRQNQLACLSDFGHTMGPSLSPEIRSDQCFIRVFTLDFEFVYVSTGMLHFYSYKVYHTLYTVRPKCLVSVHFKLSLIVSGFMGRKSLIVHLSRVQIGNCIGAIR